MKTNGIVWTSLITPYGMTTVTMQSGVFDRFIFGQRYLWCDAHQRGCGPDFSFARVGLVTAKNGHSEIIGPIAVKPPELVM